MSFKMRKSLAIVPLIVVVIIAASATCDVHATSVTGSLPTVPTVTPAAPITASPSVTPIAAPTTQTQQPAATPVVATPTPVIALKTVDLVIFAGQSNMSGRGGNAKQAPSVPVDKGYEFRIGTCPTGMYPMSEPFGIYSNGYLCDLPVLRGGSCASAFMNTYYKATGVPVLGFSAARGGTSIAYWQTAPVQRELAQKLDMIKAWCASNHIFIRRIYAVWLQGETDGVANVDKDTYERGLVNIFSPLYAKGLNQVFVITIGQYSGLPGTYDKIIAAQLELCAKDPHFSLGSDALRTLPATYLTDGCHYNQAALNIVGTQSGSAAALYTKLTGN